MEQENLIVTNQSAEETLSEETASVAMDKPIEKEDGSTSSHHHRHHHHHHHHHRSSGKKRKSEKKFFEKIWLFMKRNKKYLRHSLIALGLIFVLVLVGRYMDRRPGGNRPSPHSQSTASTPSSSADTTDSVEIRIPFFEKEVSLVGAAVEAYMNADVTTPITQIYQKFKTDSLDRLDLAVPVKLSYDIEGLPDGIAVKKAEFLVADNTGFQNPKVFQAAEGKNQVEVPHLNVNTPYYYRIRLTFSNDTVTSVEGSFRTAQSPRIISAEGVGNLRDVGGWKTESGAFLRQGLLYRGCELDGAVSPRYQMTQNGLTTMLSVLGIRTEMDLRSPTDNVYGTDTLGAGVKHTYYNAPAYSSVFLPENRDAMRRIFSDLADASRYPVYLHCSHGMDRTGTTCYLLEALLGVGEEDRMRDYQLSGLYHEVMWSLNEMDDFVAKFKALPGGTDAEKAEGYLLSIGVTKAQIQSIRSIFLGEE